MNLPQMHGHLSSCSYSAAPRIIICAQSCHQLACTQESTQQWRLVSTLQLQPSIFAAHMPLETAWQTLHCLCSRPAAVPDLHTTAEIQHASGVTASEKALLILQNTMTASTGYYLMLYRCFHPQNMCLFRYGKSMQLREVP